MRVSKIPKGKDLKSTFSEMLDLLLYKQVLTEETAEGYFEWLLNQGLDAVNWDSDKKELASELDNTNTVKRFNREINRDGIENDYFEGDSLGKFMAKFQNFKGIELIQLYTLIYLWEEEIKTTRNGKSVNVKFLN